MGAQRWWTVLTLGGMFLGAASFVFFFSLRIIHFPLTWVFGIASIVCWLMGGISILCLLLAARKSRADEIAVLRICGASRGHIRARFLLEALLVGLPGWFAGICLSLAALLIANRLMAGMQIPGSVIAVAALLSALFSLLIDLLFGWYPAQMAAALHCVEALKE